MEHYETKTLWNLWDHWNRRILYLWKATNWNFIPILTDGKQVIKSHNLILISCPYNLDSTFGRHILYVHQWKSHIQQKKIRKKTNQNHLLEKWGVLGHNTRPNPACICGRDPLSEHSWMHCMQWGKPISAPPLPLSKSHWLSSIPSSGSPTNQPCRNCTHSTIGFGHCSRHNSPSLQSDWWGSSTMLGSHIHNCRLLEVYNTLTVTYLKNKNKIKRVRKGKTK